MKEPIAFVVVCARGVGVDYQAFFIDIASVEQLEVLVAEFAAVGKEPFDVVQIADFVGEGHVLLVGHVSVAEDEYSILTC
jgi:hypothetical protein